MNDLLFFLRLFKPHLFWLIGGTLLALLASVASISLLSLSGWFITASAFAGLTHDLMIMNIMLPAAQIRALAITRTVARYAERVVTHEATFRLLSDIRVWFFAQLIPIALTRLASVRSGDLLNRITTDIDALDALYLRLINPFIIALFTIIGVTLFLYNYQPLLTIIVCVLLCSALIIPLLFNYLGQDSAENSVTLLNNLRLRHLDLLQGMTDLLANHAYARFVESFMKNNTRLLDTEGDNNHLMALSSALTLFLSQLTLLLTLVLLATQHQITGATLAMLLFTVLAVFELIQPLPNALQLLAKTTTSAKRVREFATLEHSDGKLNAPKQFDLIFKNVSFRYHEQQTWLLKDFNLNIPHGKKIAIIGDSGVGKTSLLHLLTRHYSANQGNIILCHHKLEDYQHDELLNCFGVLSQRSQLFATTIKENILIAKPDASIEQLNAALNFAGLSEFIKQLPNGLTTWVGESGINVSGGEARRIALARLYLKNPPILLLDEPTESLDSATEQAILNALMRFSENKTLIMVTHRLIGLDGFDEIIKLNHLI